MVPPKKVHFQKKTKIKLEGWGDEGRGNEREAAQEEGLDLLGRVSFL